MRKSHVATEVRVRNLRPLTSQLRWGGPMGKIFVGICAYNEENNIGRLLNNLLNEQALPRNSEIFVVCSGCTDLTPEIVRGFCEKDARVNLIMEDKRRGKASALNILFERAMHASILILVNADALPEIGSINKLIHPFRDKNVGVTMGRPVPINEPQGISNHIVHIIWNLHHDISLYKRVKLSSELCALRTSLIEKIPTNLATDEPYIEMLIRDQGYQIVYMPDAIVNIKGPDNIAGLFKQRRRIWTGHLQIQKTTGFVVSTSKLRNLLPSILKVASRSDVRKLPYLLLSVILEISAYLAARRVFRTGGIPYKWEPIKSTKNLHWEGPNVRKLK